MRRRSSWAWMLVLAGAGPATRAGAAEGTDADRFAAEVRPVLARVCSECHAGDRVEGDLDLGELAPNWEAARKHPRAWQKVAAMLDSGQMPPKDARQPTVAEREGLRRWVRDYLTAEARAQAGDPGPVGLRRLNNAEYTYTLRDLTGVDSLDPAREFPVDGAAGEGFTNAGNALAMSPALVSKYLDAAKAVAAHAVLLPDGFRFAPTTTPNDWTNEALAKVRAFYDRFTDARGGNAVTVQGLVFQTNQGGRLPLDRYLAATLVDRALWAADPIPADRVEALARQYQLSPKYLRTLGRMLATGHDPEPSVSPPIDDLRSLWRNAAGPEDAARLAAEVEAWHPALWRFNIVGHIGKVGGPKSWMEPARPIVGRQEIRHKLPTTATGRAVDVTLAVDDAGDGAAGDVAVWERPRLVAPGRPDILLRDVAAISRDLPRRRERLIGSTAACLAALDEAIQAPGAVDLPVLAARHGVSPDALTGWADALGLATGEPAPLGDPIPQKMQGVPDHPEVKGWVGDDALSLVTNPTDAPVNIPGTVPPHGVVVHPTPTRQVVVGWRSPVAATVRVSARVQDAHTACGNGVSWSVELRRGRTRQTLAAGVTEAANPNLIAPADAVAVRPGDAVALVIGPRDGSHVCDLTAIDLAIKADGAEWSLGRDVSNDVLAGNPHADGQGHPGVWHFNHEPTAALPGATIPAGSALARWREAADPAEKARFAGQVGAILAAADASPGLSPADQALRRDLLAPGGPLLRTLLRPDPAAPPVARDENRGQGVDPALFGPRDGVAVDDASLIMRGGTDLSFRLPAELAVGAELVTAGTLHPTAGAEGSVQFRVLNLRTTFPPSLRPGAPIVATGPAAQARVEAGFAAHRALFPPALCYTKIVPIDEAVTLVLLHREDEPLRRLLLDDAEAAQLDRLWDELHYLDQDALKLVDVFTQLLEFASQDADPSVFAPLRKTILDRAEAFRQQMVAAEPRHLDALVAFAGRAYRRPVTEGEARDLRQLYGKLRADGMDHDDAFRLALARVLVAPAFLLRAEQASPGVAAAPVSDRELATRLSYFLWSGPPDDELRGLAESGRLHDPEVLVAQARRMLRDGRTRRLATEFGCQWLHVYDFDHHDEKSEKHFPEFRDLRGTMHEETVRFLADLFQTGGSVLDVLGADYTFVNADLAFYYAIPDVIGPEWRRVDGIKARGRGGVLAHATTLAAQSGASRTSPTLRGNWISEVLLGERLPRPPKGVPQLPDDESATEGKTVRELVEMHARDPKCATCHAKMDPLGFALEAFDPVGRLRTADLGGRPIDTKSRAADGSEFAGLDGLRTYLLTTRRDAFVRQFCRKLLGYALGRAVQLSDEPLLDEMQSALAANGYSVAAAVEVVVRSKPFREIRGRDRVDDAE